MPPPAASNGEPTGGATWRQSWLQRYAAALLVGAIAVTLRLAMNPWFGYEVPFITFFPAVALAVWYAGVGPAVLVTALGYLAGNLLIIAPLHSLYIANVPLLALHVVYFTSCALIIAFGALARRRGELAEHTTRALQESERRHRFLVRLDDALRAQSDPQQLQRTAARLLGEHLGASQVAYLEFDPDQENFNVAGDYVDGVRSMRGRHRLSQFGDAIRQRLLQGEPFIADDVEQQQPALTDLEPWRRARVRAVFSVPLLKAGRLVAAISISQNTPRQWSADEHELVPRVVDRCWESSERARAEAALRASEVEFRTLFELSTMGVAEVDANSGRFQRANERFCQITGRTLEQLLQSTFRDITHPEDRDRDFAQVAPVLRGDVDRWESEKRYLRPDGSTVWVFVSGRLLRDRRGNPLRTIASAADISERKRAEQQLRDSERRFRVAQESSLMAFTLLQAVRDDAGVIRDFIWEYVNPAAEHFLEQPAEALLGRRMLEVLPANKDTSMLLEAYVRVVETGEPHDIEMAGHGDGVMQNISSKMDDGVAVWCMDITERKQMEADVAASRGELRLVTDTAAVMLAHCDRDARFVFVNHSYAQRFARQPEELVGLHIGDIVGAQTYQAIEPYVQRALAGQRAEFALPLELPGKGLRFMQATYVPQVDAATGAVMGFVASLADITERRALEQQLREADQRKDEFLATLAHELRNPLAPIRSAVDYIKLTGTAEPAQRRAQEIVERQILLLTRLVDDLLDLSRLNRGRVELQRQPVDLRTILNDAVEGSRPLIDGASQVLTVEVPEEPLTVYGDLARLSQVFSNLLNNAAKYTPSGGHIKLRASECGAEVVVRIQDDGVGFAPEAVERIFEMFVQGAGSPEQPQSGLGIGLTLARQLVELHDGRLEAESPGPGCGSTFSVYLPALQPGAAEAAEAAAGKQPAAAPPADSSARRVLVCDDNEDAATVLAMLLRSLGHIVHTAHDGLAAVEQTLEFHPQVVILDIGMPRLDGYEAARRIRALPGGGNIRLIALTGWGQHKDKLRAREAGFDEHLTKPVEAEVLQRLVAHAAPPGAPAH